MNFIFGKLKILASFAAFFLIITLNAGDKVKVTEWSPHAKVSCRLNMGPTGCAAWMRNENYQVMKVDEGSPADGILQTGDLVIGVNGIDFKPEVDSRMTLGNEIGNSEAKDGKITFKIRRDGKEKNVTVKIPALGPYSKTWPYDCHKSQKILDSACFRILELQSANGEIITDGGFGTYLDGLLLLASGQSRFMDGAIRAVYATADKDLKKISYPNWSLAYGGMLLAEYYLSTGDKTVLPRLKDVVDSLAKGQMYCGSWGHSNPSGGYGALNQPGVVCAITMILAKECGVEVDEKALKKAVHFYTQFAELGAVPYGDHRPNQRIPDDNGKNSTSAIMCKLHPDFQKEAATFAKSVAISYWLREEGHTGGLFSIMWGPVAAVMTGPESFRKFMDYQKWYYNLSRSWNGNLLMLPYFEALQRFDSCTYIGTNGKFTTGAMGLVYALPHKKIRILGASKSIFGAEVKNKSLLKARNAFQDRDWKTYDTAMEQLSNRGGMENDENYWFQQLKDAKKMLDATAEDTIEKINNNIKEGDAYFAQKQYLALKRFLGNKDERILELDKKFDEHIVKWHIKEGTRYYEGLEKLEVMSFISWVPYGDKTRNSMEEMTSIRPLFWVSILPVLEDKNTEKSEKKPKEGPVSLSKSFELKDTDYTNIRLLIRAPRKCHVKVKLNGVKIANIVRGQRGGYAKLPLDNSVLSLLKKGNNHVEVSSTSVGSGNNKLDFGLDAVPEKKTTGSTPEWSDSITLKGTEIPETLSKVLDQARKNFPQQKLQEKASDSFPEPYRVRESKQRFIMALNAACDKLSKNELKEALSSPISYWRYLASQTLSRKGSEGIKVAKEGLKDKDWRVRSASCDILAAIYKSRKTKNDENTDSLPSTEKSDLLKTVLDLLKDKNSWVRYRAASALGVIGENNKSAADALVEAAADSDEWVRNAALTALRNISENPEILKTASVNALNIPSTSFGPTNRSYSLLQKSGINDKSVINALIFVIDNPGEGMGAHGLNNIIKLLVKYDTEGKFAVPALMKVAAGGYKYDRLRGNPRKTSIELLGEYGSKAKDAVQLLESLSVETEDKKKKGYAEVAKKALEQIKGK